MPDPRELVITVARALTGCSEEFVVIVLVLRGVEGLIDAVATGTADVHAFLRGRLGELVADQGAAEMFGAHFESDAATQAGVPLFLDRLERATRRGE